MPQLLPFLKLTDPSTGQCAQIVDNCATLAAAAATPNWDTSNDCEECCPKCVAEDTYSGDPTQDGAWWAGTGDPAEQDFLGFVATNVDLEGALTARRVGESTSEPAPYTPRRLTVQGYFMARTRQGTYMGEARYTDFFTANAGCSSCDGWQAETRAFCPEGETPEDPVLDIWEPDQVPTLVEDPEECDPCRKQEDGYQPQRLGPALIFPQPVDRGLRNLLNVRFLSMDIDEDNADTWPYCWGRFVTIVFEVFDDYEYGENIEGVCLIDRTFDTYESGRCRPMDWTDCVAIPDQQPCDVEKEKIPTLEDVKQPTPRGTQYCSPLWRSVRACLTPVLPSAAQVGLNFTIKSGNKELKNLRLDVWKAHQGWPSPETCEGEKLYRHETACATGFLSLPKQSEMVVDMRTQEALLACSGGPAEVANRLLENWPWPMLDPACRYWVVATADCLNTDPDALVEVSFVPRYQT